MTMQRRHPEQAQQDCSSSSSHDDIPKLSEKAKGHHVMAANFRRRIKRTSKTVWPTKDELEDWALLVTSLVVVFVCILWFFGKIIVMISWIFPLLEAVMDDLLPSVGNPPHSRGTVAPFNALYTIPHAHKLVGDRTNRYALLRQRIDSKMPENAERSLQRVKDLQTQPAYGVVSNEAYDIYNCPDTPPVGYPFQWKLLDVIENWNPENTTLPDRIYNGLCVFDYGRDFDKAMTYRNAEMPFVVQHDPRIAATAERWNTPGYMEEMLGQVPHRTTYSETNHFLYAIPPHQGNKKLRHNSRHTAPPGWTEPTRAMRMSYKEWLDKANVTSDQSAQDKPHWYYRLIGCGLTGADGSCDRGSSEYLFDELPFFQPSPDGLYLRDYMEQKGIHCRFGQEGIVADNHFDAGRNTIVVLGGSRRYMLASPGQCLNMALYNKYHPSARHSEVSWSFPDLEKFPQFAKAMGNEVILQAGDALYLPNNWFHHIVSLELNFQCNTRSGKGPEYRQEIEDCGFDQPM